MRTPNCKCLVCGKPIYRRPSELARVRHVACMEHRAEAQKISGITEKQQAGLSLGRMKGTNHLIGIPKSDESKHKRSASMKRWAAKNPDDVIARAAGSRGDSHYKWKGGISKLNKSIRQMTENRRWMDAVKQRDKCCVRCGEVDGLESHHVTPLAALIDQLGIKSREDAREHANELWDLNNGITLCEQCHYEEHGRNYENRRNTFQKNAEPPAGIIQQAA